MSVWRQYTITILKTTCHSIYILIVLLMIDYCRFLRSASTGIKCNGGGPRGGTGMVGRMLLVGVELFTGNPLFRSDAFAEAGSLALGADT